MARYGTRPLDHSIYPKEIVISDRVRADLIYRTYHVKFPFDRDAVDVVKSYNIHFDGSVWCASYINPDMVRRALENVEDVLAQKDASRSPPPPPDADTEPEYGPGM